MASTYKPIGGVESVALYPADAVVTALFSSVGCKVELSGSPIEVPLLEDCSLYEESSRTEQGVRIVSHRLHIVADRDKAQEWLDNDFMERASFEGLVALISLCDGRQVLAGYSAHLASEQPLRLESLTSTSESTPNKRPSVTLRLISHDAEFSSIVL